MLRSIILLFLITTCFNHVALADEWVSIRLIEASKKNVPAQKADLEDILPFLQSQLPYTSYRKIDHQRCLLPAKKTKILLLLDYQMTCSGDKDNFTVTIQQGKKKILQTTILLKQDVPLILGGFPHHRGNIMFVLMVKGS